MNIMFTLYAEQQGKQLIVELYLKLWLIKTHLGSQYVRIDKVYVIIIT